MTGVIKQLQTQARRVQRPLPVMIGGSALLSLAMVIWVTADAPGAAAIRWVALVPVLGSLFGARYIHRTHQLTQSSVAMAAELRVANEALRQQVQDLTKLRDVMLAMGATFERAAMLDEVINAITQLLHFDRGLVLLFDELKNALIYGAYSHAAPTPDSQYMLEQLQVLLDGSAGDPLLGPWLRGESLLVEDHTPYLRSRLSWVLITLDLHLFYSVPLRVGERLTGVILVDNSLTRMPIVPEQCSLLDALAANIAVTLETARLYQLTDEKLNAKVQELSILGRIDRELNDALSMERVLNLTVDWALRFTGSHAAAVALVDHAAQTLKFVAGYGYERSTWEQMQGMVWLLTRGITGRVARLGEPEIVPDVSKDPDYVGFAPQIQSQMSVPVMREGRVIAVISLESRQPDAFNEEKLEFAKRLATRAAAAIDNALLFEETRRERQKLELILSSTADAVIVVGYDGKLALINQAALAAFRLNPKASYVGRPFNEVFVESPLRAFYERACKLPDGLIEELTLPEDRTFHTSVLPTPQVGWSIVMHDVTPFKKTEQLKNELVATTSHDLKNPLAAILGYIDLIQMTNRLNDQGLEYVRRAQRAVAHMRNLIDDLLDMARIESGITLRLVQVRLDELMLKALETFAPQIREKNMTVSMDIAANLPPVCADENRLGQVIGNLISNAIKYTPAQGHIWIRAEQQDGFVRVAVQDNGMGISPNDQAHIFTRFYRVRTPQTEGIDGTGLGLAIAKSLIEAHGGQIGLKSRLGEGSTFYFTIPCKLPEPPDAP